MDLAQQFDRGAQQLARAIVAKDPDPVARFLLNTARAFDPKSPSTLQQYAANERRPGQVS